MSEDEFVVLLEHAGITEVSDDGGQEFLEKNLLLGWLVREGIELFGAKFLFQNSSSNNNNRGDDGASSCSCSSSGDEQLGDSSSAGGDGVPPPPSDLSASGVMVEDQPRYALAQRILDRLVEREWLSPIEFDYDEDETEEWKATLFGIRLSTAEAYKIYIEKDATEMNLSASGLSLRTQALIAQSQGGDTEEVAPVSDPDGGSQLRIREKMWQDCFPMCSESCKQMYFAFESPEVILYSTLGLNLISNGISSVPAFSRDLKTMGVSAEDRTVIVGFLARAFPSE